MHVFLAKSERKYYTSYSWSANLWRGIAYSFLPILSAIGRLPRDAFIYAVYCLSVLRAICR